MMRPPPVTSSTREAEHPARPEGLGDKWKTSLMVLLIVGGVWWACLSHPVVWLASGIGETTVPFLDLSGSLAAGEVAQAHGNPYEPNALDYYHRPHLYSSWWLVTGAMGLVRADTVWLGPLQVALVLLAALGLLRPRGWAEGASMVLVLISPAVLLAVNRGNNDLVVFVIACAGLGLLRWTATGGKVAGVILLAVAAVLKYFPLATMVTLLAARTRRELAAGLGLLAVVLVVAWPGLKPGLESAARFKPHPEGLYAFGAPTVFRNFGIESSTGWLIVAAVIAAWCLSSVPGRWKREPVPPAASPEEREFACGAAVVAGCFFLGSSYSYKLIFALWLLPSLWRKPVSGTEKIWRRLIWWLLLGALWVEGVLAVLINLVLTPRGSVDFAKDLYEVTLVAGQVLSWALVAVLLRELVIYGTDRLVWLWRGNLTKAGRPVGSAESEGKRL